VLGYPLPPFWLVPPFFLPRNGYVFPRISLFGSSAGCLYRSVHPSFSLPNLVRTFHLVRWLDPLRVRGPCGFFHPLCKTPSPDFFAVLPMFTMFVNILVSLPVLNKISFVSVPCFSFRVFYLSSPVQYPPPLLSRFCFFQVSCWWRLLTSTPPPS